MNSTVSLICIAAVVLTLMLGGCATQDEEARSLLDRLEFDEDETGCIRLDGTIDLNPLPLFKTNANLTLKKQKGDNPPEC